MLRDISMFVTIVLLPGLLAVACDPTEEVDPCDGIACSGHGTCLVRDQVHALCDCDSGYLQPLDNPHLCVPDVVGDDWVAVDAGEVVDFFYIGSPETEAGRVDDERLHEVALTRDFAILSTEVTQADFESVMGYQPSHEFAHHGREYPVQMVSWHEAAGYCNALSDVHGVEQCYSCTGSAPDVECEPRIEPPNGCEGYRLPTESEWEYAARADDDRATYNGDLGEDNLDECSTPVALLEDIAWYCGTAGFEPQPTAQKEPNGLGLFDMLGNVEEWVHDHYGDYPEQELATDPHGPSSGSERVVRGGHYNSPGRDIRAASRGLAQPGERSEYRGFRPVRTLEEE